MTAIKLNIKDYSECPFSEISKVYTSDSWDDVRSITCKKQNKKVAGYLDWHDKNPPVPNWCPIKTN